MTTETAETAEDAGPRRRDKGRMGAVPVPRTRSGTELMTLGEAERRFDVPRNTLNHAALSGKLEASRLGYQWLVTPAAVEAWLRLAGGRPGRNPGQGPKRRRSSEVEQEQRGA